jgi:hypothetical protein
VDAGGKVEMGARWCRGAVVRCRGRELQAVGRSGACGGVEMAAVVVFVHAARLASLAAPGPHARLPSYLAIAKLLDAIPHHQSAWPLRTPPHLSCACTTP